MKKKTRPSLRLVTSKDFSDCIRAALSKLSAEERLIVNQYMDEVSAMFGKNMGLISVMKLLFKTDSEMIALFDALDEEVVDHALQELADD